ncbi:LysR family transcriptional regulator [Ralstonia flatus]|uniref:HTH-type transcriptional regulator DmlR n=1 Tax=Ralstonia flatus TaxID=3058601 RepID=A0AAD2F8C7_9RALS|nr:LysR family transcriptional regulator [Ralstonia sp. LMG 32965]MBN6210586.1 LysR family transcriptional regulator [Ralstonia pickettii]CAJ0867765.1 HTH-type transcriptional regulator DmlR [Ralstonia sp. LMG 32965]CAJ0879333.1 HTH-type transcriptional regulator DmlR [Ralstonia sp. LMG 32965]
MDRLDTLEALVVAADAGSFAAAGRRLGKSRDYVSKAVAELEARLDVVLIQRTTRRAALTEAGEAYVREIRPLIDGLRTADRNTVFHARGVRGKISVNAPLMWGQTVLSTYIPGYLESNPDIELEVQLSDEISAEPLAKADVTVRLSPSVDAELYSDELGQIKRMLCAAPAYLDRHGAPVAPEDLLKHECLLYGNLSSGPTWILKRRGEVVRLPVHGRFSCNNGNVLVNAACAGQGIVTLPEFVAAPYLADGRLALVLHGWEPAPLILHAIVAHANAESPRIQSFVGYLRECLSAGATKPASATRRRKLQSSRRTAGT